MNKRKVTDDCNSNSEHFDQYQTRRKFRKNNKNASYYNDNDAAYTRGVLNAGKHKSNKQRMTYRDYDKNYLSHNESIADDYDDDDADKDDNISVIVHAVLDELNNMKNSKKERNEENDNVISFAKEIDRYLKNNHTQRNRFLSNHEEFESRLGKLMKTICNADERDQLIPKFTDTEKMLMKFFYKYYEKSVKIFEKNLIFFCRKNQ